MAAGLIDIVEALGEDVEALLEEVCTALCHLQKATLSDDGEGGFEETWADTGYALPCIAFPGRGKLHGRGEVPAGKTPVTVIVKGDASATSRLRVRIHATPRTLGQTVEVVAVAKHFGVITEVAGYVQL